MKTIAMIGLGLWIVGTVAIRLVGQHVLGTQSAVRTVILYAASFLLMGLLARRIFRGAGLDKESWPRAATLLALPTLILDPFSSVFFSFVFPNIDPAAAGIFGGWMLICCAGAVAGAWVNA